MTISTPSVLTALPAVHAAVERHGKTREALVPILSDINRELGYLPPAAMAEISQLMQIPQSELLATASFYKMLSTRPRGRHIIRMCESAPCHVVGGRQVWQQLREILALAPGETSTDGRWTLLTTSCLGVCGVGPVLMVDDDVYGNVQPDQLPEILARYG